MVLGYIEETHVEDKDIAQTIWVSGCPTKGPFSAKTPKMYFYP